MPRGYTAGLANCNGQSQPSGWTYSSNGYAGNSVCGKCTAKSCPAGYSAGVTQCSNTTSWTYGSNGYAGNSICGKCTSKDCASGYTAGLANCNGKAHPAGWSYTAGTPSGNTVCGKCTAKSCTAGSTSCNSSTQNATANGYYAGDSVCYTCVAKTCEQMGQKTCNGSCIATSECCGGCPAGHECNDGTCIQTKCEAGYIFYSDGTCNSDYLADKTPVGIVADPEHRLLIDLKGINNISLLATISNINIPMIGNEYTRPISFNGYSNTTILARYTPAATTCLTKNRDGIMNNWYIPGSGEILSVGKNYQAVYAGLNKLADYGLADPNLGYLWSSDEVYSSDELGLVMNPADRQLTARPRMAMAANLRCMAHYLCSAASGCELPCPFESSGDSSNGVNGYTRKSISCDDGWLVQSYPFNSACKRCINDTVEGSSSGGNQPGKTECQVLDSMYYSNGKYFCTTAASANGTYMGKIGKKGLVILGQIGSTMSVSDAEQQCNNYTRGTFSNWRIVYTSDSDKWSSIICNVCHPFGKSGSLSMYYGGYGWNTATSYDRNGTLYCTHSYSNVYRE